MSDKKEILLETGTNELEIAEFGIYLKEDRVQSFGINVAKVREIIKVPSVTSLPDTQKDIVGIFKLRNKTIPLINLASWLNEKTDIDTEKCYVIVTEFNKANFGFLVHKIETIHRMSWEKVLPPSTFSDSFQADCITGIVTLGEKIMMMIDFERIVADINPKFGLSNIEVVHFDNEDGHKHKILIADDSSLIRKMVTDILEKGGFEVIAVNNGKEAWEYINHLKKIADDKGASIYDVLSCVVTDIEMPQMDGHSLCKKIKENADFKNMPVMLYSSLIYDEIRKKGDAIGADYQISKPDLHNVVKYAAEVIKKYQNIQK